MKTAILRTDAVDDDLRAPSGLDVAVEARPNATPRDGAPRFVRTSSPSSTDRGGGSSGHTEVTRPAAMARTKAPGVSRKIRLK